MVGGTPEISIIPRSTDALVLNVHETIPLSYVNGPGRRAVIWLQGCSRGCKGCFNPETHSFEKKHLMPVEKITGWVQSLGGSIDGITISGGEPLEQMDALLPFLERLREDTSLSILLFTGFAWEELGNLREWERLTKCLDVIIAGPFESSLPAGKGLLSSDNQTLHFLTGRHKPEDFNGQPHSEVIITPDGDIISSGIRPAFLQEMM